MYFAQPLSAATLVSAAVNVVFPWSMCPMVPTFTCGLLRSNFSLAMSTILALCCPGGNAAVIDQENLWSRCPESNWRPRPYQGRALPTELHRPSPSATADRSAGSRNHRWLASRSSLDPLSEGWSGRRGSNPRPTAWKAVTLPLSYSRFPVSQLVAREGLEPSKPLGRQIYSLLRLTASLPRQLSVCVETLFS